MKVTNNDTIVRKLNFRGSEHTLFPGQSVDFPDMTKEEGEAVGQIFWVTGEPAPSPAPAKEGKK